MWRNADRVWFEPRADEVRVVPLEFVELNDVVRGIRNRFPPDGDRVVRDLQTLLGSEVLDRDVVDSCDLLPAGPGIWYQPPTGEDALTSTIQR